MTTLFYRIQSNDTLRSMTRFMAVGTLGTLIDVLLFSGLHLGFGIPILLANTISYSAGIVNNYYIHRSWTYAHRSKKDMGKQFAQFAAVSLSALVLNNLIVLLLTPIFAANWPDLTAASILAKGCAVGIGVVWNFLANHYWTFRSK